MEEIWRYIIDHWQWNAIVMMLVIAANLQGRLSEIKRVNRWLAEHSDRLAELWADEMVLKELEKENTQ